MNTKIVRGTVLGAPARATVNFLSTCRVTRPNSLPPRCVNRIPGVLQKRNRVELLSKTEATAAAAASFPSSDDENISPTEEIVSGEKKSTPDFRSHFASHHS